jgi:hypothetical protein
MYSWDSDTSSWYGSGEYAYKPTGEDKRAAAAEKAKGGPRTYEKKNAPKEKVIDPKKHVRSESANPVIIAIDVTGSMSSWPSEIFDRLPLLYNTLCQYRPDVEICFAAIGDAVVDAWPLQVTSFANGFDLEQLLGSMAAHGGGGDAAESYGLFAQWVNTHVEVPNVKESPFLILFGDAPMHPLVARDQLENILGDPSQQDINSLDAWQQVGRTWNTWFLRRPSPLRGDEVDQQWGKAIGEQKIFRIEDEQRAVDYALGLIARAWGCFDDFQENLRARQSEEKVKLVSQLVEMVCPRCGAPLPLEAKDGMLQCTYCGITLKL